MTHFRQERDQPAIGKAVLVGMVSMVIFAIGVAVAGRILSGTEAGLKEAVGEPPPVPDTELSEVGIVNQPMFDVDRRTPLRIERAGRWLRSYGRDEKTGAIHIPVERAMDLMVSEAQGGGRKP
ncbi:MAG TPA: hypothetical protein VH877_13310 [Polyangia bacterium]|nr:hypothetical protein [Polyangia bacterium]